MFSQIALVGALCCLTLWPDLVEATSLMKIIKPEASAPAAISAVSINPEEAHRFLSHPRPKRNLDPKWHRNTPDFQAYYKYYNSIGHVEGLYEIDRIRMLYQQMRHLELVHGPNASLYQSTLGLLPAKCDPTKDKKCKAPSPTLPHPPLPPSTPPPPPPPSTAPPPPPPMSQAGVVYLCNPKDPLCKPHLVYLPTGAVPMLCDPRFDPACKSKPQGASGEAPATPAPPPLSLPHPEPKKSLPPPSPPPIVYKGMEYDCDPYWDPDCLIDHPPRPVKSKDAPPAPPVPAEADEEEAKKEDLVPPVPEPELLAKNQKPSPFLYDYRHELFDPYLYTQPAPEPE